MNIPEDPSYLPLFLLDPSALTSLDQGWIMSTKIIKIKLLMHFVALYHLEFKCYVFNLNKSKF